MLKVKNVKKSFDNLKVLNGIDLDVEKKGRNLNNRPIRIW